MSKCNRCGVSIVDNTDSCPLCHHVLVREAEEKDNMYPDARVLTRRFRFLENIVLFLSIVIFLNKSSLILSATLFPNLTLVDVGKT